MTFKEWRIKELTEKIQTMQSELQTLQNELEEISKEDSSWIDFDVKLLDMEDFPDHNISGGIPYIARAIGIACETYDIPCSAYSVTVEDLLSCKKENIANGYCIGKKRMEKLMAWMAKYNLKFHEKPVEY